MFAGRTARRGHSQPCGLRYRYHLEFKGGDTPELLELKSSTSSTIRCHLRCCDSRTSEQGGHCTFAVTSFGNASSPALDKPHLNQLWVCPGFGCP